MIAGGTVRKDCTAFLHTSQKNDGFKKQFLFAFPFKESKGPGTRIASGPGLYEKNKTDYLSETGEVREKRKELGYKTYPSSVQWCEGADLNPHEVAFTRT